MTGIVTGKVERCLLSGCDGTLTYHGDLPWGIHPRRWHWDGVQIKQLWQCTNPQRRHHNPLGLVFIDQPSGRTFGFGGEP